MSEEKNRVEGSTLYLVATPIGNLADISERAIKVLCEADFIAAEDTRNSLRLLMALGIKNELVSYHEHNKRASGEKIVARLLAGESCALITDAGMPAISDPGEDIVRLCSEAGVTVSVIPGACAAVSALSVSGLPTSRFAFEGFLPAVKGERRKRLLAVRSDDRTLIFYEAPHKLRATLDDMRDIFGEGRKISLCRELTKLNEEVIRVSLGEAAQLYQQKEPRGEYVLIVEGCQGADEAVGQATPPELSPEEQVNLYISGGMTKKDAIKLVAKERSVPKSEIYNLFVND